MFAKVIFNMNNINTNDISQQKEQKKTIASTMVFFMNNHFKYQLSRTDMIKVYFKIPIKSISKELHILDNSGKRVCQSTKTNY
jgi:hypothetical protein